MLANRRQAGFSLIELLISLVISMVVVLGTTNLYIAIVQNTKSVNERNRLTDEVRAVTGTLARDLRRAGYWEANMGVDDIWDNPFTASGTTDLSLSKFTGEADDSCVLYSYDLNTDGLVGDPNDPSDRSERYGFRLNDMAIEVFRDGNYACDDGTWEEVTTPEVSITQFAFALAEDCFDITTETAATCPCTSGNACQHIRRVDISLQAELTNNSNVTEFFSESVKVRNDKFVLSVP